MSYTYAINEGKKHLGGNFIEGDPATFCPTAWKSIIEKYKIKSILDVGSGRGYAAKLFNELGLDVTAIDGLEDNVKNAIYPTIIHDLTLGAFEKSVDLVNCIEVVEHIEEKYLNNLLDTLCSGKFLFMTHATPGQPGWHHVNCQPAEYWINHLLARNFQLLQEDSKELRWLARQDKAKHIAKTGMLFKNAKF